jgi:hypothetical protein
MLGVGVLAVLLSGCWPTPGAGPSRRSFNAYEQTLTPDRVPTLTEAFRVPLDHGAGPPVVTNAGLFVRTGLSIAAFERGTGAARWSVRLPAAGVPDDRASAGDPFIVDDERVLATTTVLYSGGFYAYEMVTLDTATGAAERRPTRGALQSLRHPELAVEGRSGRPSDLTTLFVEDVDGGGMSARRSTAGWPSCGGSSTSASTPGWWPTAFRPADARRRDATPAAHP